MNAFRKNDKSKNRVLILSTGGTLGMQAGNGGPLKPDKVLQDMLTWVPELHDYARAHVEILANIDSSLATPDLWLNLARRIERAHHEEEWDGIVILHGTDTLAYTASALSFLLPALDIPVVLTGGQRPLSATRTDSRNNIIGAVESALEGPVEVMIFFNNTAFRGNRVVKAAIGDFDGFDSPNYPPLGKAGIYWDWFPDRFWPESKRPSLWSAIPDSLPPTPWVLPWTPGLDFEKLIPAFSHHWAVILEAFGTGNMPFSRQMSDFLRKWMDDGGLIFIKSQVPKGRVLQDAYEPGKTIHKMGIPGGFDMTREAMVTKLLALKGLGMNNDKIKHHMSRSMAGELTAKR